GNLESGKRLPAPVARAVRALHSWSDGTGHQPATMGLAVGCARRKERQKACGDCGGAKVGRAAASFVGERRGLRTAGRSSCGSCIGKEPQVEKGEWFVNL